MRLPQDRILHIDTELAGDEVRVVVEWQGELVRCKDCTHRFVDGENVKYNCCELNHNKYMADEWHCADGERREP